MSRLSACFKDWAERGHSAVVPYIVAGDPEPGLTVGLMHELVQQGADIIELGVPFSDPMAEGPVIQKAHERALEHNVSLRNVLSMVTEFRQKDTKTPVVLMGYANPVEHMGYEQFAEAASAAGVDGLLTVDMPPEEAEPLSNVLKQKQLDCVFLLAPTTTDERIAAIARLASGYLYCVSLKGVTGAGNLDVDAVADKMAQIRRHTDLPVTVGFGIKDGESASAIAPLCEGVVIGSALVDRLFHAKDKDQIERECELIGEIRVAVDAL